MTIEKGTVLTRVKQITKRTGETDIDDILLEALLELSERTGNLTTLATETTTADQNYVDAPDDLAGNLIHSVQLDDDRPLAPITWLEALNNNRRGHGSNQHSFNNYNRGGYCLYKKRIYISPSPGAGRTCNIEYSQLDDNVEAILLPDEFLGAIVRLTAAKLYEKYELWNEVEKELVLYERAFRLLHTENPTPPVCQPGNDLEM